MFDYLDELIYERDVRGVLPVEHEATVSPPRTESDAGNPTTGTDRAVSRGVADSDHGNGPVGSERDDGPPSSEHGDGATDSNGSGVGSGEQWTVSASYRGVPLAEVSAREVKAVTYSEMELERTDAGWRAYVVLDV